MNKNILVAYASKRGATAEIAQKIGEVLRQKGFQSEVRQVDQVKDLSAYNMVVLGSAVYVGQWRKEAVKFLKDNENRLAEMAVWVFISGPTGPGEPMELIEGRFCPESLRPVLERIKPLGITCFGGKVDLKDLSFMEKMIVNKVKAPIGDFRNWEDIKAWAEGLSKHDIKSV